MLGASESLAKDVAPVFYLRARAMRNDDFDVDVSLSHDAQQRRRDERNLLVVISGFLEMLRLACYALSHCALPYPTTKDQMFERFAVLREK